MIRQLLVVLLLCLFTLGCSSELETDYGSRTGVSAGSVNGTSVLAEMFKSAGHTISGASWAGPNLAKSADVIVWFPDSVQVPDAKQRSWFEHWLCEGPDRTLVYVGRDYDAAIAYWKIALTLATDEQKEPIRRELQRAEDRFATVRLGMPAEADCGWFTAVRRLRHREIRELAGSRQWLAGIDPASVDIELNGRLLPGKGARRLLVSKGDMLVFEKKFCASKLLVVTNGSFLLNLPLVNHEHRKLAGTLIESVGESRRVTFLESGPEGLSVHDQEPASVGRSGLAILVTEPFDIPILHLAVLGVIFCLARFPIFGRPRGWQSDALADFGAHIAALGKLLAATKDRAFALATLAAYQRTTHLGAARGSRRTTTPIEPANRAETQASQPTHPDERTP